MTFSIACLFVCVAVSVNLAYGNECTIHEGLSLAYRYTTRQTDAAGMETHCFCTRSKNADGSYAYQLKLLDASTCVSAKGNVIQAGPGLQVVNGVAYECYVDETTFKVVGPIAKSCQVGDVSFGSEDEYTSFVSMTKIREQKTNNDDWATCERVEDGADLAVTFYNHGGCVLDKVVGAGDVKARNHQLGAAAQYSDKISCELSEDGSHTTMGQSDADGCLLLGPTFIANGAVGLAKGDCHYCQLTRDDTWGPVSVAHKMAAGESCTCTSECDTTDAHSLGDSWVACGVSNECQLTNVGGAWSINNYESHCVPATGSVLHAGETCYLSESAVNGVHYCNETPSANGNDAVCTCNMVSAGNLDLQCV